jgi:hypothetical protein
MRGSVAKSGAQSDAGTSSVEHLVLVVTVAVAFAAASVPLGAMLVSYHQLIERVLSLPVP